jgi:hypothetical protein
MGHPNSSSLVGVQIDKRVVRLVDALNTLPGVTTVSSCGGHRRPALGQVGPGRFYVSLDISRRQATWRSLETILVTIAALGGTALEPWIDGGGIRMDIGGTADPNLLASTLMHNAKSR